jgi:hypothetical protein
MDNRLVEASRIGPVLESCWQIRCTNRRAGFAVLPGGFMTQQSARSWIWTALIVQFVGYVFDAFWHGLLHPAVEPETVREMVRHLATVHLPLYVGALGVLVATGAALFQRLRRSRTPGALPVAFGGAVLSTLAEAWHASSHLQMDTHTGPIAGSLSFVGFVVAVAAMWLESRRRRRRAQGRIAHRRAA